MNINAGSILWCREMKSKGIIRTGKTRSCSCGSGSGGRVYVKWDDGDVTWPCTAAIHQIDENEYQIS